MRTQEFITHIANKYNPTEAQKLAHQPGIDGGWEVWLQVEIARIFRDIELNTLFTREKKYETPRGYISYNRNGTATYTNNYKKGAKCDFHLTRNNGTDETHLELKCINPNNGNPEADAWNRYQQDVDKIKAIRELTGFTLGISLLAYYGTFNKIPELFDHGNINSFIWDPFASNRVTIGREVQLGGSPRFFLLGCSY